MAEHYARQAGVSGLDILVAEDNLVNQQVVEGILRKAGHSVRIASNGDIALEILSDDLDDIDMLILDMNMPEISGVEVLKSLRFMDTSGRLPVIMLTADATPEAKESSLKAGANRFLTKPIDAHDLLECIASLSKNIHKEKISKPVKSESRKPLHSSFCTSEWYDNMVLHELDMLGENPDFILTLFKNFQYEGSQHILDIRKAMYDDYLEYREHLHALKGSATELGANKLAEVCLDAEALKPYDMDSDKIKQMCLRVEEAFQNTVAALNTAATFNNNVYPSRKTEL
jgi:two-component system sensor histidine kinase RpfC